MQEEVELSGDRTTRESTTDPLIKSNQDDKSDKEFVKLKLRRDLTSDMSYFYEFKMAFFYNGNT